MASMTRMRAPQKRIWEPSENLNTTANNPRPTCTDTSWERGRCFSTNCRQNHQRDNDANDQSPDNCRWPVLGESAIMVKTHAETDSGKSTQHHAAQGGASQIGHGVAVNLAHLRSPHQRQHFPANFRAQNSVAGGIDMHAVGVEFGIRHAIGSAKGGTEITKRQPRYIG